MADKTRAFRGPDSLEAEKITRDAVGPMLRQRGFEVLSDTWLSGTSRNSQLIIARGPDGAQLKMIVKICWRWKDERARKHSATQLIARLIDNDWEKTLGSIAERANRRATHFLIVQADGDQIVLAVMLPVMELPAIWQRQREVSWELAKSGKLGRMKKNHAENGRSPTLWLRDEREAGREAVGDVVWRWPSAIDVLALQMSPEAQFGDDTFDDLPGGSSAGRDAGARVPMTKSGYKRDSAVRRHVLRRAGGRCERMGCGEGRAYPGFLDVHHTMGVENSDRVWTCVALCPNCHREAHFSPEREDINQKLQDYALTFREV